MDVSGKTVLLTGATGGLGQAIARAFARRGARLVLTGRRTEVLEPLAAQLGARTIAVDLAVPAEVDRLIAEAGDVDVLIANAALPASGRIERFTVEEIDRALAVNLRAPIVLARAYAPAMAQRGGGHIVLMSSLSGKAAMAGGSLYSATKFGLRGFGLALREDWRDRGVGVSVVSPGFIRDAGMFHDAGATLPPGVGTRSPEDVAEATLRAVERNRGEVEVAPPQLRLGALASQVVPELAARVARRMGAGKVAGELAEGQRDKR
ncbi:MAG: SDR family NAD(P)-dependent oxidoreductase [Solirubrobacteraceae bacterium]|nr:SDR family NAD(P)-dependent oxidoreductase [Solirubrobacteraceae bacterium]